MQINMTSLRLYVKDTWVFYQARDSYYTGILKDIEIYKNLIICNFISLIMEFVCTFFTYNYYGMLSDFVIKIYLIK